jgi:hypothetical protein
MKTCPVGEELFHVERCTDMTKLLVAFCNFAMCLQTKKYIVLDLE